MSKKPRSDSPLGALPEDRQRAIVDYMRGHSLTDTRAWLRKDGFDTSEAALSRFWSSWHLREAVNEAKNDTEEFLELAKKQFPELDQAQLDQFGSAFFQMRAIKAGDAETYLALSTAKHRGQMDKLKFEQKEKQLELEREKFEEMKRKAAERDEAKKVIDDQTISPEEQRQRLREILK